MMQTIYRNGTILLGMIMTGLAAAVASGALISPRGAMGPTMLQAQSPAVAVIAIVVLLLISIGVAAGVSRLINAAVGIFVLGWGIAILAMRSATIEEIAFGGGSLSMVAIETLVWALLILGATIAVFKLGGPLDDISPDPDTDKRPGLFSKQSLISAAAGVIVLPVVWLLTRTTAPGQAAGAVLVGAMLAGLAGRLLSPHVQPILLFASPCFFGAIGHFIGQTMLRGASLSDAYVNGSVPMLSLPMPLDYAAGTLIGIPLGLGWAKSFLHEEEDDERTKSAPSTA